MLSCGWFLLRLKHNNKNPVVELAMAPKSLAPGLTAEEREALNQLLAKAQQSGESVVSNGVDGYGSYVAGSAPAPSMLSPSDPAIAPTGTPLFTPDGISYQVGMLVVFTIIAKVPVRLWVMVVL